MSTTSSLTSPRGLTRRGFIGYSAAAAAIAGAGPLLAAPKTKSRPKPVKQNFEHVIVVTMENRSFDHFLGWLPGADGRQAGLTYRDRNGKRRSTYPLAPDYQGCGKSDPDHSYEGGRIEYNNGACDGWLRAGDNDEFAIGYYRKAELPFFAGATATWSVCDRYFAAIMAETWPNKIYEWAAQTDRLDSTPELCQLPTIFDRLAQHGYQGRYYFSDIPFSALWGARYLGISRPVTEFFDACAAGTLPQVSYVDPRYFGEQIGLSNDDHPHADIRNGQVFLNQIYEAVRNSPAWGRTVLVINYDEWGGFFDHVPPGLAPIPPSDRALGSDGRRGFRVPALIISPFARRATVHHQVFDHTSVLRMIEERWQLEPLTVRDASANSLALTLDLNHPIMDAPRYAVPSGPFGQLCLPTLAESSRPAEPSKWEVLGDMALSQGFPVNLP